MKRKCRSVPLSKQPLVLVLGQVKFSPIRQLTTFTPAIQENFRRHDFPVERSGKVQRVMFSSHGGAPEVVDEQRWEYRNKNETWSVLVTEDSVVLQTTSYTTFEDFAEKLLHVVETVLALTEHDKYGVVERVGLRYIDVVKPNEGEDYRYYLRPGFHGAEDDVFVMGTHRLHVESVGATTVGEEMGTMVLRVVQNNQGFSLPPDLVSGAPKHTRRSAPGELITLIDMDHYIEGSFEPEAAQVIERAYGMHDHLIETFHNNVVTEEAIEAWK